ncbi:D-hexose-6-phosphate mutarotase [soil metagenome]
MIEKQTDEQTDEQNAGIKKLEIPGIFAIDASNELVKATVTTKLCEAEIYLQGAHLTQWQPLGHEPVLFLSERSSFTKGKAIRGGVPIIFPWFGARTATTSSNRTDGPAHGFARTADWQLLSARMDNEQLILSLSLEANETSKALGFDQFRLTYRLILGSELTMELTVENLSATTLEFAEALHTYFLVSDAPEAQISGLGGSLYYDKTDHFKQKRQEEAVLALVGETDRPYTSNAATVLLTDPVLKRQIEVSKSNSQTTVVWNPGANLTAKMADMEPDGWQKMVCIEAANALENAITLAPGAQHTMSSQVVVTSCV